MKCIDCPYYDFQEHCCIRTDERCIEDDWQDEQDYLIEQREREEDQEQILRELAEGENQ